MELHVSKSLKPFLVFKPRKSYACSHLINLADLLDLCGKLYRPAQNILEEIAETLALRHISYINHRIAWRANLAIVFATGFLAISPKIAIAASFGSLTETVTGFDTPYTFNATSGSGITTPVTFEADILPNSSRTVNLSSFLTSSAAGTSTAEVSLESIFSIFNVSTNSTDLVISFTPSFLYSLSVLGSSPPVTTGSASTALSNALTGSMFNDVITTGSKSSPVLTKPTTVLGNLSPNQSISIPATFATSSQTSGLGVTSNAINTANALITIENTSPSAVARVRAEKAARYSVAVPEPITIAGSVLAGGVLGILRRRQKQCLSRS